MKEYIEQAVAIEQARNELDLINKSHWSADEIVDFLKRLPTADVVKVQHGRWIDMGGFISCSVCSATRMKEFESYYGKAVRPYVRTNYCPSCGAKMDGGTNN